MLGRTVFVNSCGGIAVKRGYVCNGAAQALGCGIEIDFLDLLSRQRRLEVYSDQTADILELKICGSTVCKHRSLNNSRGVILGNRICCILFTPVFCRIKSIVRPGCQLGSTVVGEITMGRVAGRSVESYRWSSKNVISYGNHVSAAP